MPEEGQKNEPGRQESINQLSLSHWAQDNNGYCKNLVERLVLGAQGQGMTFRFPTIFNVECYRDTYCDLQYTPCPTELLCNGFNVINKNIDN